MASIVDKLKYEPETGEFTWKRTLSSRAVLGSKAGCHRRDGYRMIRIGNKLMYAHRLAILLHTGIEPIGVVDHIDGDPRNNKISNLRVVSQADNVQNRRAANKNNSSTHVRGVTRTAKGKYVAQVVVNRSRVYCRSFDDLDSAALAASQARKLYMTCAS